MSQVGATMGLHGLRDGEAQLGSATEDVGFLSTVPASPGSRRLAYIALGVSALCFLVLAPFATVPLTPVWAFVPTYNAALALNDLITAALLTTQAQISRSRALLVLAAGYFFTALMAVPHSLTFPGLFASNGLLGAGAQSTAWLYMFWHGGFPLFVIAYSMLRGQSAPLKYPGLAIAGTALGVAAAVIAFAALSTVGATLLPPIMEGNGYKTALPIVVSILWLLSLAAFFLLWRRRPLSALDLWLGVVMVAWLLDIALSALLNAGRFDVGFYAGRIYGLSAASFVLLVLMAETGSLQARLARSLAELDERHRELDRARQQLHQAQKMEAIGQLTGGLAHDFNNLLTALIGNLEMARELPETTTRQGHFIDAAEKSADRGARLTHQLLAFGQRQTLRSRPTSINALLKEFELLLGRALGDKIALELDLNPQLWWCSADPSLLQASLLNLMLNARDASLAGGKVTIATSNHRRGPDDAATEEDWKTGDYVAMAVTDEGVGMKAEVRERAFEPFFTTKGVGEGSGLGLSQVYGSVKQMGGHAKIDSEPGRGTTVILFLPRAAAQSAAVREARADRVSAEKNETILVVEDDDEVRRTVMGTLAALGYRVLAAANGSEAISMLGSEQRIDLLFTDVVMPGIGGVEVAREAKRLRHDIKILLTSGYAHDILIAHGANGNFPLFQKPYRPQDLVQHIRQMLNQDKAG
jgi:signal transduction histidine kinase/CheY-like chemotaxis protein